MARRLIVVMVVAALAVAVLGELPAVAQDQQPERLLDLIRAAQNKNVKKSIGTMAYQCFTDEDLARFRDSGRASKIVEGAKQDPQFKAVVMAIRAMPEAARQELLARARKVCMQTWAQMGFIDPDGKGQTEAGQQAQLMISAAFVGAVQEMIGVRQ